MRISFDIDDTLVCAAGIPTEQHVPWWRRAWYPELLRRGTRDLMRELTRQRHTLWVYTTSYRHPRYLRGWFACFGISLEGVVNQTRHERRVKGEAFKGYPPSKYPPAFGIDLHVDDSEGVATEGKEHRFRVLVVAPDDTEWTRRVLEAVESRERH
jgi:hypothetical protein